MDEADEPQGEFEGDEFEVVNPECGVEEKEWTGPAYDPSNFKVTKTGWMNYCVLLCAVADRKRYDLLQRIVTKLKLKPEVRFKILNLQSHLQKFGDSGPRRFGFDFD